MYWSYSVAAAALLGSCDGLLALRCQRAEVYVTLWAEIAPGPSVFLSELRRVAAQLTSVVGS